jgi:hypothetical protein
MVSACAAGAARSVGAVAANDDVWASRSRIPAELAASATVNAPTAVSPAPEPSAIDSVAVLPPTVSAESVPPEGTLVRVHGAIPAV